MRNGNQSKGIGFVCFNTIEQTTKALNEMNGKWILSKPIYVKLSKNNDNSFEIPSTSPTNLTHPTVTPMPYPNIPMVVYIPTIMVPRPSSNFPLPIVPSNVRIPPPLPPSNTTQMIRQAYPYNRVKSDDQ
jgi:RNA recognition motif-containing protein